MLRALALALVLGTGSLALADSVTIPPLTGRVVDLTATLTPAQVQSLTDTLQGFEKRKGSQLAVLLVPRFREGDFAGGVQDGVERMIRVIEGEALPPPENGAGQNDTGIGTYALVALLFAVFLGGLLRRVLGRFPGALVTGGLVGFLAWLVAGAISMAFVCALVAFAVTLAGGGLIRPVIGGVWGNRGTGFRGFGRGGGSRNSGSSGGFRGGGGGFGGGGASGRW